MKTKLVDPYFGQEIEFDDCEILAVQHIDHKILKKESSLFGTKWFDYIELHPTQATYLMTHHYNRAYGRFMEQGFDKKKKFMSGFRKKNFFLSREKKSFWKLRQKIDELGIRYEFFCREAMNWCLANGWRQPPRPAHLTTNNDLIVFVMDKWDVECREKIQFATSPRYVTADFIGSPDQLRYEEWIVSRVLKKRNRKYALHAALYVHEAIRIETALYRFAADEVIEAIEYCHSAR